MKAQAYIYIHEDGSLCVYTSGGCTCITTNTLKPIHNGGDYRCCCVISEWYENKNEAKKN